MKRNIALGILTLLAVDFHTASSADACGVKLTVKSSTPRKAVARTSNPSSILLLGSPPHRLEANLTAAGHRVEVAPSARAATRKSYAVVIADANLQDEARSSFPGAVVIVRSGDIAADTRSVEQQVARRPVRTDESRTVVAAQPRRAPIAAGPSQPSGPSGRRVVRASEPQDAQAPPEPPPPPSPLASERVAAAVPRPAPIAPEPRSPPASGDRTTPEAAAHPTHAEVFFTLGSSTLGNEANRPLSRAVRWLTDNRQAHVVIEGHADPTGSHALNMALGQRRAEQVRDYLMAAGIDPSRLEVISYGDTRLKYSRTDRRNRRAAIVVK